jgi:pyridoxine kinase
MVDLPSWNGLAGGRGGDYKESRDGGKLRQLPGEGLMASDIPTIGPRIAHDQQPAATKQAPAEILAISSQVVYGHVGNSAAVFALQRLGHEVWPLPTVLYSNHPGHGKFAGEEVNNALLSALLAELRRRGIPERCGGMLTGYMRSKDQVSIAAVAAAEVKLHETPTVICCDPAVGDRHTGLYVPDETAKEIAEWLVPLAYIVTPNHFELEYLTETQFDTLHAARDAARALWGRGLGPEIVVCTSLVERDAPPGTIATLAASADGAWIVRTPVLERVPHGGGDLLAALYLAAYLETRSVATALSRAVSSTYAVLKASVEAGMDELALIAAQDQLIAPAQMFAAEPLT